jgi:hypothetical protein
MSIERRRRARIIGLAATVVAAVLSAFVLLGLAALVSRVLPVTVPPGSAGPEVVLDAYLRTLVAGDCATGRGFWSAGPPGQHGDLCSATWVWSYRFDPAAARPPDGEVIFATYLTTTGSDDDSVPPGEIIWFYRLRQQPEGAWRIVGGGSGP